MERAVVRFADKYRYRFEAGQLEARQRRSPLIII